MFLLLYVDEEKKTVTAEVYGTPLADGMTIKLESVDVEITPFDPTPVVVTDPDLVRKGRNRIVAEAWKVYYDKDGKEIDAVGYQIFFHHHSPTLSLSRFCQAGPQA